jgi:hypothetical protein
MPLRSAATPDARMDIVSRLPTNRNIASATK